MNPGQQKPSIPRPPALSRPGGKVAVARPILPIPPKAPASKVGLWVSLGFHACLIAAACTVTWTKLGEKGEGKDDTAGDRGDFEMQISHREPQASAPEPPAAAVPPPTPQLPAPQASFLFVNQLPALRPLALFEPMPSVLAAKPSPPAAPPTASHPTGKSGSVQTGKPSGKKGSGAGKRAKQPTPVRPPQLLSSPPPRYPAAARAAKKTGKVGVLVQVRANGAAAATSVYRSSGNPQLDQAAVTAARSWKFSQSPSLASGATIAVVVQVTFAL